MAADEASFNTEIFSISDGVKSLQLPGSPSIKIKGSGVAPKEPTPRTRIEASSLPGLPLLWVIVTPERWPVSMFETFETPRDSNCLLFTVDIDPTTSTFF